MILRGWIDDIRIKTKGMNGNDRAEYIAEYYWYHILLAFLGIGLVVLLLYHVTAGRRAVSFACIIVNEKIDAARDRSLAEEFAQALAQETKKIRVDSDYRISYPGHVEEGSNESDYEKFFFGWSEGEFDAVIMPRSFFSYCTELGGEFRSISEEGARSIPLDETVLSGEIMENAGDPMVIVFPSNGEHEREAGLFLEYALRDSEPLSLSRADRSQEYSAGIFAETGGVWHEDSF